jgi:hypothetical protein
MLIGPWELLIILFLLLGSIFSGCAMLLVWTRKKK